MSSSFIQETHTQNLPHDKSKYFSGFSRNMPCSSSSYNKDFNFFKDFKNPVQETYKKSQYVVQSVGCEKLWPNNLQKNYLANFQDFINPSSIQEMSTIVNPASQETFKYPQYVVYNNMGAPKDCYLNNYEAYKYWLVNINHGMSGDHQFISPIRKQDEKFIEKGQLAIENNYCNDVNDTQSRHEQGVNMKVNDLSMKVATMDDQRMGMGMGMTQNMNMPFHVASIPKPQDEYNIVVNNVNQPFQHVWLQRSQDGSRLIHPLERFPFFNFVDPNANTFEPLKPPAIETAPFKLVQEVNELRELVDKLRVVNEFAVDLEHNQYRSYQGLTCLMQISTRTEDFIVDTLKLWVHIGPYFRDLFSDPTKRKVMHGADNDIMWLQRDFGIYVCNMFDTGQASRVLKMERNSLQYVLLYYCGVALNKDYQKADWRVRPLTNEMLRYAREDTHYLLHLQDLIKKRLLSSSPDPGHPEALLVEAYRRSYVVCLRLYQKEVVDQDSYLSIYGLHDADLNGQQLSIVAALCGWRDIVARAEDESTGYVLSNKCLIEIAKQMPTTIGELCNLLQFWNPTIERNFESIINIVKYSKRNGAAFESVARTHKQERMEMQAAQFRQKMRGESSSMSIGTSNNVVTNQFWNAAGKRKLSLDTKAPVNIKFGTFSTKPGSLLQTIRESAHTRKLPTAIEPNVSSSRPVNRSVLQTAVINPTMEKGGRAGAANEDEKNLSDLSSSFQKCLQTTNDENMSQARIGGAGPDRAF